MEQQNLFHSGVYKLANFFFLICDFVNFACLIINHTFILFIKKCCGVVGYKDFDQASKWTQYNSGLDEPLPAPPACCSYDPEYCSWLVSKMPVRVPSALPLPVCSLTPPPMLVFIYPIYTCKNLSLLVYVHMLAMAE